MVNDQRGEIVHCDGVLTSVVLQHVREGGAAVYTVGAGHVVVGLTVGAHTARNEAKTKHSEVVSVLTDRVRTPLSQDKPTYGNKHYATLKTTKVEDTVDCG